MILFRKSRTGVYKCGENAIIPPAPLPPHKANYAGERNLV
jgi:hypothetical protein